MRPSPVIAGLTIAVLAIGLAGCGQDTPVGDAAIATAPAASVSPTAPAASVSPTAPGSSADGTAVAAVPDVLRFEADLVGGGSYDAAQLAGEPVAFWFWAPT